MAISYPLFDQLNASTESLSIPLSQISFTLMNLRNREHLEEIYALILHYAITVDNYQNLNLPPYKGSILNNGLGINFQMTNLPIRLQTILALYLQKYAQK
jgi:hypothetical protein